MGLNAFQRMGNTVTFTADTVATAQVQASSGTNNGNQYRVINTGTVTVFLGYGMTADQANSSAVVVTSSQPAFPILPNTDEILTFVPNAYFTGTTSSDTATIYITPGDGL